VVNYRVFLSDVATYGFPPISLSENQIILSTRYSRCQLRSKAAPKCFSSFDHSTCALSPATNASISFETLPTDEGVVVETWEMVTEPPAIVGDSGTRLPVVVTQGRKIIYDCPSLLEMDWGSLAKFGRR
jgi:hypothetical protein